MSIDKEKLEGLLIDYIDGKLNEVDKHKVEQELIQHADSYKLYEQLREVIGTMEGSSPLIPGDELKVSFEESLKMEIEKEKREAKVVRLRPAFYRVAAAIAILAVAGTLGYLIYKHQEREAALAAIQEEMRQTRELIMEKLNNDLSASQRIQGVNVALTVEKADDEIVRALVNTMNEDPNTNVRMAALDALSKFHRDPQVRKALIKSLGNQKDPVIQIALIQLMVRMKEKSIVEGLQKIIDDDKTLKAVKDEAHSGILKLS